MIEVFPYNYYYLICHWPNNTTTRRRCSCELQAMPTALSNKRPSNKPRWSGCRHTSETWLQGPTADRLISQAEPCRRPTCSSPHACSTCPATPRTSSAAGCRASRLPRQPPSWRTCSPRPYSDNTQAQSHTLFTRPPSHERKQTGLKLSHITSRQLRSLSPVYRASGSNYMTLAYSWKQTPPWQQMMFLWIFRLAGSGLRLSTVRSESDSSPKLLDFTFSNYLVSLNFLSPTTRFFQIPFANFLIYLLWLLSATLPRSFLSLSSAYFLFLTMSGNTCSNSGNSSTFSTNSMQVSSSLTLSSEFSPYLSNISMSFLSQPETRPLQQSSCSISQNQFSLLFLAWPIISPALFRCHYIFLYFSLHSVYSS